MLKTLSNPVLIYHSAYLNARDIGGRTALHLAAKFPPNRYGRGPEPGAELVKALVSAGADLFLYSPDLGVPPPYSDIPRSFLQTPLPKTYPLNMDGFAYVFANAVAKFSGDTAICGLDQLIMIAKKKRYASHVAKWRHPKTGMSLFHISCRFPKCGIAFAKALQGSIDLNAPSPFGTPLFYSNSYVSDS